VIRRTSAAVLVSASALALGLVALSGSATGAGTPVRATAYIRADVGLATFNPDVNPNSNCATPDSDDTQRVGAPGTTANNVHIDACLFSSGAAAGATVSDVDVPVTYELFGAGTISACPDPDGAGPKTAVRHDHDGDGNFEHCHQSGYQSTGTGALEYHARVNNTVAAGQTRVLFCNDPDQDGCLDEAVRSQVAIGWLPAAPATAG
jgi:hypothetical protein